MDTCTQNLGIIIILITIHNLAYNMLEVMVHLEGRMCFKSCILHCWLLKILHIWISISIVWIHFLDCNLGTVKMDPSNWKINFPIFPGFLTSSKLNVWPLQKLRKLKFYTKILLLFQTRAFLSATVSLPTAAAVCIWHQPKVPPVLSTPVISTLINSIPFISIAASIPNT